MTTPDDPTAVLPAVRVCAGCGEGFQPRRRGRPGRYCRPACRQRAWALRQAEAELLADGLVPASEQVPAAPAVPTTAGDWERLLGVLEAQLFDPGGVLARRPWEHVRLYDALGRALAALDAATPGGLDWIDRNDQQE